jgi:hypothetical protein
MEVGVRERIQNRIRELVWDCQLWAKVRATSDALTLHSPVVRPSSPCLTQLARVSNVQVLKRHGGG